MKMKERTRFEAIKIFTIKTFLFLFVSICWIEWISHFYISVLERKIIKFHILCNWNEIDKLRSNFTNFNLGAWAGRIIFARFILQKIQTCESHRTHEEAKNLVPGAASVWHNGQVSNLLDLHEEKTSLWPATQSKTG